MATKRNTWWLRGGNVIHVEEHHDGNYGAPGKKRAKKSKPTKEQQLLINSMNKAKRARLRLLEYFKPGDWFCTWTYDPKKRPADMKAAKDDFRKAIKFVRKEYKNRERELFWIRNIERGTKGKWHIHIIVNDIGIDTAGILTKAWNHGEINNLKEIKFNNTLYDEDFTKLSNYITKDENTRYKKQNGEYGKPRLKEASYSTSRNMPIPEPKPDKLIHWKKEVKPKKGYYIVRSYEDINPMGFKYRIYTMVRLGSETDTELREIEEMRAQWNSE